MPPLNCFLITIITLVRKALDFCVLISWASFLDGPPRVWLVKTVTDKECCSLELCLSVCLKEGNVGVLEDRHSTAAGASLGRI